MSLLLRTTALMLLVLSRAPAFAATLPYDVSAEETREESRDQVSARFFKHSLSGLYAIHTSERNVLQPYQDLDTLYSHAAQAQTELETLCQSTAMLTSTQAYFAGVKSYPRAAKKVELEFDGNAQRITDLARATLIADDVPSLVEAYEILSREATIVKVKNRFKNPAPSGYRDLMVLIQLPGSKLIAEVQLHLKAIADVKSGPEHQLYEEIQAIERRAGQEKRGLNDWEQAKIHHIRQHSRDLYQNAWQPYITTRIQAA